MSGRFAKGGLAALTKVCSFSETIILELLTMSSEADRRPTRLDSHTTKVEAKEEPSESIQYSIEKQPRFSYNQPSLPDNPYNPVCSFLIR